MVTADATRLKPSEPSLRYVSYGYATTAVGTLQRRIAIPTKLLVCDDELVLRTLIRATLEPHGYAIVEAADGDESIELARRERPDLIVLDLMMPGRSGLDVLAELRRDRDLSSTPVVMLSARTQLADRDAAKLAGADRFLAKPFSPYDLASVVTELLAKTS